MRQGTASAPRSGLPAPTSIRRRNAGCRRMSGFRGAAGGTVHRPRSRRHRTGRRPAWGADRGRALRRRPSGGRRGTGRRAAWPYRPSPGAGCCRKGSPGPRPALPCRDSASRAELPARRSRDRRRGSAGPRASRPTTFARRCSWLDPSKGSRRRRPVRGIATRQTLNSASMTSGSPNSATNRSRHSALIASRCTATPTRSGTAVAPSTSTSRATAATRASGAASASS